MSDVSVTPYEVQKYMSVMQEVGESLANHTAWSRTEDGSSTFFRNIETSEAQCTV